MMRCHQHCGGAADCTSTEQWMSRWSTGDGGSHLYEELGCVPEACDVRVTVAAILKEKLTLKPTDEVDTAVWNPDTGRTPVRTNSDNASERLFTATSRAWGTPARMSARVWMSTRPCDEVQLVLPKEERT